MTTVLTTTWNGKPWRSLDEFVAARASCAGTLLVTGATGFVGGHFLYWWRRSGGRAVAVVRASDEHSARQRLMLRQHEVAGAYTHVAPSELGAITVMPGDVRLPLFGLKASQLNALGAENIGSVWHFAASLRFEQGQSSELMADNVEGTRNAMAVAKAVGAHRFVHISTAYSCGAADGWVAEGLHSLAGPFNNSYEESKCRAEHLVMSESSALGLQSRILRPSIVVGPSTTWRTGGSESGLYGLLNRLQRLSSLPREIARRPIKVAGRSTAQLNLVPVDAVIRDCLNLATANFPGGPIYHLTSLAGPMMCEAADVASELLGLPPIRIGDPDGKASHVEKWLDRQLRFYLPYFGFEGRFARSLPGPTHVDLHGLRGLVANYARSNLAPARAKIAPPNSPAQSGTAHVRRTKVARSIAAIGIAAKRRRRPLQNETVETRTGGTGPMPEMDAYPDEITNLLELVERASELYGDAIYIVATEKGLGDISFTGLHTFTRNFGDYLDEEGIKVGDSLASVFHNSTLAALLFVATISAGRVYVPLNPKMAKAEISHILRQTKPRLTLYNAEFKSRLVGVDNAGRLTTVVDEAAFLMDIMKRSPAASRFDLGADQHDRAAEVVFTSGSTGLPKGVVLTHRNLLRNSFAMATAFGFDRGSRFLTACPLFHNSGQLFTSLSALWCGGLHVPVRSDFAMLNFWDLVDRYELQWTVVMNSFLALLVQRPESPKRGSMRGILSGGSKLKLELVDRFESRFNVPVLQCYGLTETTSISTAERPGKALASRGSAGTPMPGCRIRIVLEGEEKPRGEQGEILVSGDHLFSHYLNLPDVTAEKVRDGWLHTGDLGYMDAEGNVFIVDRLDSMVHIGGENVYPNEIENLSMLLDGVEDMVVTAIPSKILGAELVLVYKMRDGEQPRMSSWTDVFVRHLSTFKIPRLRLAVGELGLDGIPRAANGKLLRATIKEAVLAKLGA